MAQLPGDGADHLRRAARAARRRGRRAGLALAALLLLPVAARAELDLVGTWHVLVHYRDLESNNPEAERWLDRVWVFEARGPGLRWTDFPIVVFDDPSGRFERRASGQYARLLEFWQPSPAQRANIRRGLQVNDRGSRAQTLRGSPAEGWASATRARPSSASVVSYSDHWSIESPGGLPVFTRRESLSSGLSDSLEGVTRYATKKISADAHRLQGRYERDGRQRGLFTMRRAGDRRGLEGSGKSQRQRAMEALMGEPVAPEGTGR